MAGAICGALGASAAPLKVVATIKPVHSLVAGVMQGAGAPELLISGMASEHSYTLRPSQAKALQNADLIFWIGPELETFLVKPLRALAANARIVALSEAENITLWPLRDPGIQGALTPRYAGSDMHIWLDPRNAAAMVQAIIRALTEADPAQAAIYRNNGKAMLVRLEALEHEIAAAFRESPGGGGYIVFHDAYRYFEERFGLRPAAIISIDPERPPGAARIQKIKEQMAITPIACIFAEPQFEPKIVQRLVEGTKTRIGVLDPLGAALPEGGGLYFALLADMARGIRSCFQ